MKPTTDATDATAPPVDPFRIPPDVRERLDSLTEAVASANRAAHAHTQELSALRFTLIFALVVASAVYLHKARVVG